MLSDKAFWDRIKGLEGKEVFTPGRAEPRTITQVTKKAVKILNRKSLVGFYGEWGLYQNYHILHRDGFLSPGDNSSSYSISIGIVLSAVPEEVFLDGLGLKLNTKSSQHGVKKDMGARKYWIVSPNVDGTDRNVEKWKEEILRTHSAMMGWSPDDYTNGREMGPKFAGKTDTSVQFGDIILIARRHRLNHEVVGFGVVNGECVKKIFPWSASPAYLRKLKPFITVEQTPKDLPIIDVLQYTIALRQLHPDYSGKEAHDQVCRWMEKRLRLKSDRNEESQVTETELPKNYSFDYSVRTKDHVKNARKVEAELLKNYDAWLQKRGHQLSAWKLNRFRCDAWENERLNLVEAKGSTSREDIRMAVGQLVDYAFQGKERFKEPHMAILLPKEPTSESIKWLESIDIKVIWRNGSSFSDNAKGQFI